MRPTYFLACVTLCLMGTTGCIGDAVFFNRQLAQINLTNSETLLPVDGATIQAARVEPLRERNSELTDQEFINRYGDSAVTTDGNGTATYSFRFVTICCGLAALTCDRVQGHLIGKEYLFLVQTANRSEILSGTLNPNTHVKGTFYDIAIGDLGEPELDTTR